MQQPLISEQKPQQALRSTHPHISQKASYLSDKDTSERMKTSVGIDGMVLRQLVQETSLNINVVT